MQKEICESGCSGIEKKAEQRSITINQTASAGIELRVIARSGTQDTEEEQRFMALRSCTNR